MTEKQELRAEFRSLRRSLPEAEYRQRSDAVVARARLLPELANARSVHCYWPSLRNREVDTRPLIEELAARDAEVLLPVVEVFGPVRATPRMSHVRYEPGMEMAPNRWGIAEPVDGRRVQPEGLEVIVVPALACDARGIRLGQGLGYYDEFLHATSGVRVCLCMDPFVVETLPSEPHDVPVHIIVTETRTIRTGQSLMA